MTIHNSLSGKQLLLQKLVTQDFELPGSNVIVVNKSFSIMEERIILFK